MNASAGVLPDTSLFSPYSAMLPAGRWSGSLLKVEESRSRTTAGAAGAATAGGVYHVGEFRLEPALGQVIGPRTEAHLTPRTMDLLVYLLEQAPRVVSADELLDTFWPGRIVETSTIHRRISQIRHVLGDKASDPSLIATVPKRGYRVIGEVRKPDSVARPQDALTGATSDDDASTPPRSHDVPFIGRGEILARLQDSLRSAESGRAHVVFLTGAPGMGKTRCAQELVARGRRTFDVYDTWCDELVAGAPYWPWINILRDVVTDDRAELLSPDAEHQLAALAELAPELALRFPNLPALPKLDADARRVRLCDAMSTLLHRLAAERPLLLFIDDLHSADRESLSLLEFVARNNRSSRLLLLATARDAELRRQRALAGTVATLSRRCEFERVAVGALAEAELGLLAACFSSEPERIARVIAEKTDGNPLHATLLARALANGDQDAIPASLQDVIVGSFSSLSEDTWRVVSTAAVIGREFPRELLRSVTQISSRGVDTAARDAWRGGVFNENGQFAHALVLEAAYAEIPVIERRALHGAVAACLAVQPHELMDVASTIRLARHFALSGQAIEAARWYGRANRKLFTRHSRQAYDCSLAALAVLEEQLATEPTEALARWIIGSTIGALHCAGVAQIPGDEVAGILQRAREMIPHIEAGARQLGLLLTVYSDYLAISRQADEALRRAQEACEIARGCDDEGIRLHASITLIGRFTNLDRREEAFEIAMREIEHPPEDRLASFGDGSWPAYPRILAFAAGHRAAQGQPGEALQWVNEALRLLRPDGQEVAPEDLDIRIDGAAYLGSAQTLLECIAAAGNCYRYLGDAGRLAKCATHYQKWVRDHDPLSRPAGYRLTASLHCLERRWDALASMKNQAPADFAGNTIDLFIVALRALALAQLGDHAQARQLAEIVLNGNARREPETFLAVARALLRQGREGLRAATQLTAEIETLIQETGTAANLPFLCEVKAEIARVAGDDVACQRHQNRARELWLQMGATAHNDRVALELDSLEMLADSERSSR